MWPGPGSGGSIGSGELVAARLARGTGEQSRVLGAVMAVDTGPWRRVRVTTLEAGWPTLATAAVMAAW